MQHLWCTEGHVYQVWAFTLDFCSIAILILTNAADWNALLVDLLFKIHWNTSPLMQVKCNFFSLMPGTGMECGSQPVQSLQWWANFLCPALAWTQFIALDFRADAFTAAPWSCMLADAYLLLQCCSVCMFGSSQISNLNPWLAFVGLDQRHLMSGCV